MTSKASSSLKSTYDLQKEAGQFKQHNDIKFGPAAKMSFLPRQVALKKEVKDVKSKAGFVPRQVTINQGLKRRASSKAKPQRASKGPKTSSSNNSGFNTKPTTTKRASSLDEESESSSAAKKVKTIEVDGVRPSSEGKTNYLTSTYEKRKAEWQMNGEYANKKGRIEPSHKERVEKLKEGLECLSEAYGKMKGAKRPWNESGVSVEGEGEKAKKVKMTKEDFEEMIRGRAEKKAADDKARSSKKRARDDDEGVEDANSSKKLKLTASAEDVTKDHGEPNKNTKKRAREDDGIEEISERKKIKFTLSDKDANKNENKENSDTKKRSRDDNEDEDAGTRKKAKVVSDEESRKDDTAQQAQLPTPTQLPIQTSCLPSLPAEIINVIFGHLDPVTSTCLGLTAKRCFEIHKTFHPKPLPLTRESTIKGARKTKLSTLLKDWAGDEYLFSNKREKFVKKENWVAATDRCKRPRWWMRGGKGMTKRARERRAEANRRAVIAQWNARERKEAEERREKYKEEREARDQAIERGDVLGSMQAFSRDGVYGNRRQGSKARKRRLQV